MALFEDGILGALTEKGIASALGVGLAVGVGAIVLAPALLSFAGRVARPVTKAVIKTGLRIYGEGRTVASEVAESFGDMVAESKAELMNQERQELDFFERREETQGPSPAGSNPSGKESEKAGRTKPWIVRGW